MTRTYLLHLTVTVENPGECAGDTRPDRETGVATYLGAVLAEHLESGDRVDELTAFELADEPYEEPARKSRRRRNFDHIDG